MTETMNETETPYLPAIGERCRVTNDHPRTSDLMTGNTVQVSQRTAGVGLYVRLVGAYDVVSTRDWYVHGEDLEPLGADATEARDPALVEALAEVVRLREQVANSASTIASLHAWQRNAVSDVSDVISENLINEARSRDWCGDYDSIVAKINRNCTVLALRERTQSWDTRRQVRVTMSFYVTQNGSYDGPGEPDDEDNVEWDTLDAYDVREIARYADFEVDDDDTDGFEAEVRES